MVTPPVIDFRLNVVPPVGGPAAVVTVNDIPLLVPADVVTVTLPLVAPVGTVTTMLVELQLVGVAAIPLNVTVPEESKFTPVMVTDVPTGPVNGFRLVIVGTLGPLVTVNCTPLLDTPPTVTTMFPVVAPLGIVMLMLVSLQLLMGIKSLQWMGPLVAPLNIPIEELDAPESVPGMNCTFETPAAPLVVKLK